MKIMTILGTRPEIIRLSVIIPLLDEHAERHVLVHTGQNFTASLSGIFFAELGLRAPDYVLQDKQAGLGASWPPCSGAWRASCFRRSPTGFCCWVTRTARCVQSLPSGWVFLSYTWKQATAVTI